MVANVKSAPLVWFWFGSSLDGLAVEMKRTSEPPHESTSTRRAAPAPAARCGIGTCVAARNPGEHESLGCTEFCGDLDLAQSRLRQHARRSRCERRSHQRHIGKLLVLERQLGPLDL